MSLWGERFIRFSVAAIFVSLAALLCTQALAQDESTAIHAPTEIGIGGEFEVFIDHAGPGRDYLTITAPDAFDAETGTKPVHINGEWGMGNAHEGRISRKVQAPDKPGTYELRYVKFRGGREVLARSPLRVVDVGARITTPSRVPVGAWVRVAWQGPGNKGDVLSLVPFDHPDNQRLSQSWAYAKKESATNLVLHAPAKPGRYEVRYYTGSQVLARSIVDVLPSKGTFKTPESAMAGSLLAVSWSGQRTPSDTIALAAISAPDKTVTSLQMPSGNTSLSLDLPENPGSYELRYLDHDGEVTAVAPLTITEAQAKLEAPAEVAADSVFELKWSGPAHPRDELALRANPSEASSASSRAPTSAGERVRLRAPRQPGETTLCYVTAQSRACLASAKIRVLPTQTGTVRVAGRGTADQDDKPVNVAVVVDASANMLERAGRGRKLDAAKQVLRRWSTSLPGEESAGTLRISSSRALGHCRSEAAVPLGPIEGAAWDEAVAGMQSEEGGKSGLAQAIKAAAADLAPVRGERTAILLVGGEDQCGGDVPAAIAALGKLGNSLRLQVVGIAIQNAMFEDSLQQAVRAANGTYVRAFDNADVQNALADALLPRFELVSESGKVVASGAVGGAAVEVAAGSYSVRVAGRTNRATANVAVAAGKQAAVELDQGPPPPTVHAAAALEPQEFPR